MYKLVRTKGGEKIVKTTKIGWGKYSVFSNNTINRVVCIRVRIAKYRVLAKYLATDPEQWLINFFH